MLLHTNSRIPLQDKVDASLLQLNQMQNQKSMFEEQLAQAARSTTDQQTSFDKHMAVAAKAALDASDVKEACAIAVAQVRGQGYLKGQAQGGGRITTNLICHSACRPIHASLLLCRTRLTQDSSLTIRWPKPLWRPVT